MGDTDLLLNIGIFLILALACIGLGIFFLLRTGRTSTMLRNTNKQDSPEVASEVAASVVEKILMKKGLLIERWRKTNRLRDQMKILKISTNAKKAHQHP